MIVKAPGPDELLGTAVKEEPLLSAFFRIMRLKRLFRQGWLKRGVPMERCESVAEHSFGVAMLALLLCPAGRVSGDGMIGDATQGVSSQDSLPDRNRAVLMSLVHELGETYAGDITPVDGVSKKEKEELERAALLKALGNHQDARWFLDIWEEFEEGKSPEARFVRQLDRLEMGLEASLHRAEGSVRMEEFFESARRAVQDNELRALLERGIAASGSAKEESR